MTEMCFDLHRHTYTFRLLFILRVSKYVCYFIDSRNYWLDRTHDTYTHTAVFLIAHLLCCHFSGTNNSYSSIRFQLEFKLRCLVKTNKFFSDLYVCVGINYVLYSFFSFLISMRLSRRQIDDDYWKKNSTMTKKYFYFVKEITMCCDRMTEG